MWRATLFMTHCSNSCTYMLIQKFKWSHKNATFNILIRDTTIFIPRSSIIDSLSRVGVNTRMLLQTVYFDKFKLQHRTRTERYWKYELIHLSSILYIALPNKIVGKLSCFQYGYNETAFLKLLSRQKFIWIYLKQSK